MKNALELKGLSRLALTITCVIIVLVAGCTFKKFSIEDFWFDPSRTPAKAPPIP